jgi:hypothetical protein
LAVLLFCNDICQLPEIAGVEEDELVLAVLPPPHALKTIKSACKDATKKEGMAFIYLILPSGD